LVTAAVLAPPCTAHSADSVSVVLEMKDGVLTPERIEIPANTQVKIVLRNTGTTPAEFESLRLRKEKVLAPGVESFVVIHKASPGEYPFFDDFHLDGKPGLIIAR
jgi:hypothetical protein